MSLVHTLGVFCVLVHVLCVDVWLWLGFACKPAGSGVSQCVVTQFVAPWCFDGASVMLVGLSWLSYGLVWCFDEGGRIGSRVSK
jgi:hypothetical protein